MFITKKQLEELIDKKIKEAFEDWGFKIDRKKENMFYIDSDCGIYYPINHINPFDDKIEENKHRLNLLLKHLKLEYYKIKETNSEEKKYVEEGFRKIKVGKKKK